MYGDSGEMRVPLWSTNYVPGTLHLKTLAMVSHRPSAQSGLSSASYQLYDLRQETQ